MPRTVGCKQLPFLFVSRPSHLFVQKFYFILGAIQVLRNADGGDGVSNFSGKKRFEGSMLSALRGVGGGSNSRKKAFRNT